VFCCAMTMRSAERTHEYHALMHQVIERLERLLTLLVLLFVGIGLTHGLLAHLDWRGIVLAGAVVFVVRPLAGAVALWAGGQPLGGARPRDGGLEVRERLAAAFFGVRGIGSIYYLAYGLGMATFREERWLWSTVAFTIVLSVLVHGITATPVMQALDRHRERLGVDRGRADGRPPDPR
jgi:NhaP-type Na+/H+ or K+/H+ antiporter